VKFAIRDNNEAMVSNFAKQLNKGVSFLETLLKVAKEEQSLCTHLSLSLSHVVLVVFGDRELQAECWWKIQERKQTT